MLFVLATMRTVRGSWRESRWRVRGLLGTCDYHTGDKRGIPRLFFLGNLRLPIFMWHRYNRPATERPEPQQPPLATGAAAVPG